MSEFEHGAMDIEAQEKTFEGFVRMSVYVIAGSLCILIFLALFNS